MKVLESEKNPNEQYLSDHELDKLLESAYEEIMWLARRAENNASDARSWYTHVIGQKLKKRIRHFTGRVSINAVKEVSSPLRLEHYERIHQTLTKLIEEHLISGDDPSKFIQLIKICERVNIVTVDENYAVIKAKGDYSMAGIELIEWKVIPKKKRQLLWDKVLKRNVANADEFKP